MAGIDFLATGVYVITETVPLGWEVDIVCTSSDGFFVEVDNDTGTLTLTSTTPNVSNQADCTFFNTELSSPSCGIAPAGGVGIAQVPDCLEIIKQTDPDGADEEFLFEVTGDFTDDFDLEDDEVQVYSLPSLDISAGEEATVTEIVPDGWRLDDIECQGEGMTFDTHPEDNFVTITFVGGGNPDFGVCTFFNEEDPDGDEDEDEDERFVPGPNLGGLFGGVNTAQQNRERAGVIYATPLPAVVEAIRPPSTGDGGLLP
ncbi:MAG: hypothetical protein GEU75_09535 [Dehalococcoidia bacterium]|nr:hypothetical protein [Dehalococcoidia bacterium]